MISLIGVIMLKDEWAPLINLFLTLHAPHSTLISCAVMQPPTRSPFSTVSKDDRELMDLSYDKAKLNKCQEAQVGKFIKSAPCCLY